MPPNWSLYPKPPAKVFTYGTAGFRARAEILESTFYRMGILAVLRSRSRNGLAVGLMVTASHNAEPDNGIKLIDVDGGMLSQSWESDATSLANAGDEEAEAAMAAISAAHKVAAHGGLVFVGRDSRTHSARLASIALEGIRSMSAMPPAGIGIDCGLLTTPQLHHIVRHQNGAAGAGPFVGPKDWASESGYGEMLLQAYSELVPSTAKSAASPLWVDAACGVGGLKLAALQVALHSLQRRRPCSVRAAHRTRRGVGVARCARAPSVDREQRRRWCAQ